MSDPEVLELLTWISRRPRTYPEAIDVWQTHCPRHSLWEDALADGLIRIVRNGLSSQVAHATGRDGARDKALTETVGVSLR